MGDGDHQGAYARFIRQRENEIMRVPEGLSLRDAALAEPLAVALHGITNSGIQPGERALVVEDTVTTGGSFVARVNAERAHLYTLGGQPVEPPGPSPDVPDRTT